VSQILLINNTLKTDICRTAFLRKLTVRLASRENCDLQLQLILRFITLVILVL
jgi:hypothetical protein